MQDKAKPFQAIIEEMNETLGVTLGIIDLSSTVIACSDPKRIGTITPNVSFSESYSLFTYDGYTFKPFGEKNKTPNYAVFVEGADADTDVYANMLAVTFSSIKNFFDDKYDRVSFIKSATTNSVVALQGDMSTKIRDLHLNNEARRVVFFIKVSNISETSVLEVVQNLFPNDTLDFVFTHSDSDVILVKDIKNIQSPDNLDSLAESICDTLSGELFVNVKVGIGTVAATIKDLAESYRDAKTALEVGKIFELDKRVVNYSGLGVARLVYHVPISLCHQYMKEVFKKGSVESLDQETLFTIQKFFDNNLNVSETSRKLFVHRNTLVYRLEKIKKLTGLDLREFEHAITFKLALMVKKRLTNDITKV